MPEAYEEFEAASLFCPRCRKAVPVRKKLLLVLPTGTKYDYLCAECGAPVGSKVDQDPTEFRRLAPLPGPAGPRGASPGGTALVRPIQARHRT
ncbi:MAG: hypothetical protein HY724_04480 [Candidatus Rokubacteria bacterium]|nr:hypothetical protein [Candidatus Rokubacteria bacterium]